MIHATPTSTIEVSNPATGHLLIPGVHDGGCGIQGAAAEGAAALTVAFRWARGPRRPEQAVGSKVTLDGAGYVLATARRSEVSQGFYVATLQAVA